MCINGVELNFVSVFIIISIFFYFLFIILIGLLGLESPKSTYRGIHIGDKLSGGYIIKDIKYEYNESGYAPYGRWDTYDEHEYYVYVENINNKEVNKYKKSEIYNFFKPEV